MDVSHEQSSVVWTFLCDGSFMTDSAPTHQTAWIDGPPAQLMVYMVVLNQLTRRSRHRKLTRRSKHAQTTHQTVKTRSDNSPDGQDTLRQLTRRSRHTQTTHQTVKTRADNSPDGQDALRQLTRRSKQAQTTHQTVKTSSDNSPDGQDQARHGRWWSAGRRPDRSAPAPGLGDL